MSTVLSSLKKDDLEELVKLVVDQLAEEELRDIQWRESLVPRWFQNEEDASTAVCGVISRINSVINGCDGLSRDETDEVVRKCVKGRTEEVRNGLNDIMTCHSKKEPFLNDIDWRINYVFSCNKMSDLNEPVVNMDLKLSNGTVESIEMNSEEVNLMLDTLKQAREELK